MAFQMRQAMAVVRMAGMDKHSSKIFTRRELQYCRSRPKPFQHFAARFAAKKALLQILPKSFRGNYSEIEILKKSSGATEVKFSKKLLKQNPFLKKACIYVSLTHDEKWAGAAVVIQYEKTKK